ncbi:hypothetical protein ACLO87_08940 [Paenalcaligenes sp. Me52]|uniref:hypothetical protein n=1 Tax=Paenalcaligenes sp. Me52 TaxID=3392038 RepID=UPI003D2A04C7
MSTPQPMNPIAELTRLGWAIEERHAQQFQLPKEISARHPQLPTALLHFLGSLVSCVNHAETAWFLCEADFHNTDASTFRWNEWELISLESAGDDCVLRSAVVSFWDRHFPFMLSVSDGYGYYAIDTSVEHFGRVVMGLEPEFEKVDVVAESFEQFLAQLTAENIQS